MIENFVWSKRTWTLVAHYKNLGYKHLDELPEEMAIVGKNQNISFRKKLVTKHSATYDPIGVIISCEEYNNIMLVVRDW